MPPKFKRHLNDDEVTGSVKSERRNLLEEDSDEEEDFFLRKPFGPRNDKIRHVQNQVDEVIDVMQENITKVIERGERLDDLQDKSDSLSDNAAAFSKRAKHLRRQMWWRDCKVSKKGNGQGWGCGRVVTCCPWEEVEQLCFPAGSTLGAKASCQVEAPCVRCLCAALADEGDHSDGGAHSPARHHRAHSAEVPILTGSWRLRGAASGISHLLCNLSEISVYNLEVVFSPGSRRWWQAASSKGVFEELPNNPFPVKYLSCCQAFFYNTRFRSQFHMFCGILGVWFGFGAGYLPLQSICIYG